MKGMRLLLALVFLAGIVVAASAADPPEPAAAGGSGGKIDEKFQKAKQWLSENRMDVRDKADDALMGDYILVASYGAPSKNSNTPGTRKLTAARAAEVLAYRQIGEILDGVAVVGTTVVKDMELVSDDVAAAMAAFVKGAQVVYSEYNDSEGLALVLMKVGRGGPRGYGEILYGKLANDPKVKAALEKKEPEQKPAFKPAGAPPPPEETYDGLILDATGVSFRPALMNRVFTKKGDVVYDPSKISQKVLVEQGCGEYTNNVDKAKAALGTRGVKNPLVVKAVGAASPSDIQVSDDDALRIYTASQKEPFLSAAKVAFVLK